MDIEFTPLHMKTLCKLNELANKHGCQISFGQNNSRDLSVDYDELKKCGELSDETLEKLQEYRSNTYNERSEYTSFWFELYDPKATGITHNVYAYVESEVSFSLNDQNENIQDLVYSAQNVTHEDLTFTYNYFSRTNTEIRGFKNQDATNSKAYRSGIVLKFFGDLVCDYLKEPRIEAVY